jgi:poly-beta-1,6-N-acetyl-D-glucosamine synthase
MLKLDALLWIDLVTNGYWLLSFGYLVLFPSLGYFWFKKEKETDLPTPLPPLSLVVAIRNEAANLPALFAQISQLTYPSLEVLFVNDNSEDSSPQMLKQTVDEAQALGKDWKLLHSQGQGKKAAISTALTVAKGTLIATTDADCAFGANWLERLAAPFSDDKIQMVAGPVMINPHPNYIFSTFQQVESVSILLVTRFCFSLDIPLMCSASNMAYRKSAFEQVNGYVGNLQFLSGDDEFLLKKVAGAFGNNSVKYLHQPELFVTTAPQSSWSSFISQRARWASKWRLHDFGHMLIAALSGLMLLLYMLSPALLFLGKAGWQAFTGLWILKILAEFWVVAGVLKQFKIPLTLGQMIIASFIHPFYAFATAMSISSNGWEWKGRKQA